MADIIDLANDRAQTDLDAALSIARNTTQALMPNGACYSCEKALDGDLRFCDVNCRNDWQRLNPHG